MLTMDQPPTLNVDTYFNVVELIAIDTEALTFTVWVEVRTPICYPVLKQPTHDTFIVDLLSCQLFFQSLKIGGIHV